MVKAYDRVSWAYRFLVMIKIKFGAEVLSR